MRLIIVAVALLLVVVSPSSAQQPSKPDSGAIAQMAGMFNQMGPMYESHEPGDD